MSIEKFDFKEHVASTMEKMAGTPKQKETLLELMLFCFEEGYQAKAKRKKKISKFDNFIKSTRGEEWE